MLLREDNYIKAAYIDPMRINAPRGDARRSSPEADGGALERSVAQNGVMVPLIVKKCEWPSPRFELISGARRLAAAKRAGCRRVPAVIIAGDEERALRCGVLSDSHRAERGGFEYACALEKLMLARGEGPEQLANSLGMTPEELADALSALKLEEDEQLVCRAAGLTDKEARSILALPRSERNRLFYGLLSDNRELSVRARVLRERLAAGAATSGSHTRAIAFNDVRIFFNTIDRALDVMKEAGVDAESERQDADGFVEYRIRIPFSEAFSRR